MEGRYRKKAEEYEVVELWIMEGLSHSAQELGVELVCLWTRFNLRTLGGKAILVPQVAMEVA